MTDSQSIPASEDCYLFLRTVDGEARYYVRCSDGAEIEVYPDFSDIIIVKNV